MRVSGALSWQKLAQALGRVGQGGEAKKIKMSSSGVTMAAMTIGRELSTACPM